MSTKDLDLFISRRKKVVCDRCRGFIGEGEYLFSVDEKRGGTCRRCIPVDSLSFLPAGDRAMTLRSKKHSSVCYAVYVWDNRRRRYHRQGQYVTRESLVLAKESCKADAAVRSERSVRAAQKRSVEEIEYLAKFAEEVRRLFPGCPVGREKEIALHACEKYSNRVGRSAGAKKMDAELITRAVIAHIRHIETDYDARFGIGKKKRDVRSEIIPTVHKIVSLWRHVPRG